MLGCFVLPLVQELSPLYALTVLEAVSHTALALPEFTVGSWRTGINQGIRIKSRSSGVVLPEGDAWGSEGA